MPRRLSRSNEERNTLSINETYNSLVSIINFSFQDESYLGANFPALKKDEWQKIKESQLTEVDIYTSFDLLSSIEARFTLDYHIRCEKRFRDEITKRFRELKGKLETKSQRVEFERDILEIWENCYPQENIFSEIKSAFRYRHWIAHGRYWNPKLGRKYDFTYINLISANIDNFLYHYTF
ncbi:MAG: hypothetical protein FWB78_08470 [Treponema sp.]|nr:hypothetical protein [Treponema sp.]